MATTQGVSLVAFFTRVSDKAVGGTYMTLLNTIANLGYYKYLLVSLIKNDHNMLFQSLLILEIIRLVEE